MYEQFARLYDRLMRDTPYDAWAQSLDERLRGLKRPGCRPLVLDLACGTGNMTLRLARMGYEMIGVDSSGDMLAEAWDKSERARRHVLFLQQDMRALELFGTVDAAVSVCDGLNYILTDGDLAAVFARVALFMNPGGLFLFDMNTAHKFQNVLDGRVFTDSVGGASYIWENRYDPVTRVHLYDVRFLARAGRGEARYFEERHRERAYPPEVVTAMLQAAGFTDVAVTEAYTPNAPAPDSERLSFAARKG